MMYLGHMSVGVHRTKEENDTNLLYCTYSDSPSIKALLWYQGLVSGYVDVL